MTDLIRMKNVLENLRSNMCPDIPKYLVEQVLEVEVKMQDEGNRLNDVDNIVNQYLNDVKEGN